MKKLKKFAALLLAGALVLSVLTGCGASDTTKKKAVLTALQSAAKKPENENYTVIEDKELAAAKTQYIFEQFKLEGGEPYDEKRIEEDYQKVLRYRETENDDDIITCLAVYEPDWSEQYGVILIEMPRKADKTSTWNKAGEVIFASMWGYKAYSKQTLTVAISIIKDVKLTEEQEEPKDYMLVFAKQPVGEGGGEGGGEDGGGIIVM